MCRRVLLRPGQHRNALFAHVRLRSGQFKQQHRPAGLAGENDFSRRPFGAEHAFPIEKLADGGLHPRPKQRQR
jgi:hypothetical protein